MDIQPSNDIDLQEIFVRIIRYFRNHLLFIVISTLLGMGLGVVGWSLLPPVYESEMILMSDILTESYSERITQTLNRLIKEQNPGALATKLGITLEEAKEVKSIEIQSIIQEVGPDEIEPRIFIVTVEIGNELVLPKLQEGFIYFLRNNEYVKIRVKQRENLFTTLIDKLDREIKSLDSLERRISVGKPIYAARGEMLLVDPSKIYSSIIELTKQRAEYKNALELIHSIQLVEGFTLFEKPRNPKLSVLLIVGFGFGFMLAIGVLTLKHLITLSMKDDA